MSTSKLIVIGNDYFEIPNADMDQYKLLGDKLNKAKLYISGMAADVLGQCDTGEQGGSPCGGVWDGGRDDGTGKEW